MLGSTAHKRLGAVALAVLLAGTATACGSSGDATTEANVAFNQLPPCPMEALEKSTEPVQIDVWDRKAVEQTTALKQLADEFNASQKKVHVNVVLVDTSALLYQAFKVNSGMTSAPADVTAAGALGSAPPPALVLLEGSTMREMADAGAVLPAQSCINATKFDSSIIAPAVRAQYSIGGVQWPAYMGVAVPAMAYNAAMFKKAGLDPAKPPRTIAELEADARKIKAAGLSTHPIAMVIDPMLIETWLTGAGASLVSNGNGRESDAERATFYSQAAVELFTSLRRMYDEGLIQFSENENGQINHLVSMANGTSAISFDVSSVATSVQAFVDGNKKAQQQAKDLPGTDSLGNSTITTDYRSGLFPGLKEAGKINVYGTAWFINRNAPPEQQAAAWAFSEFMYKRSSQATWLTVGAFLPVSPKTMDDPKVKAFWNSGLAGNWLKLTADELNKLDGSQPGPLIGPHSDYEDIMRAAMREISERPDMTPEQIINEAEQKLTNRLSTYNTSHG